METTLIILKPDAVQRGLMGRIIDRFERKGLAVVGAKFMKVSEEIATQHYAEHQGKPFFPDLLSFITSSPVLVLALRGDGAVAVCRKLIGQTNGAEADPGTIRGDFGLSKSLNMVHGSDSLESAERELAIWFGEGEIVDYDRSVQGWISS